MCVCTGLGGVGLGARERRLRSSCLGDTAVAVGCGAAWHLYKCKGPLVLCEQQPRGMMHRDGDKQGSPTMLGVLSSSVS